MSLIQFKLNKSRHYVSQNLCWIRGIKFLSVDKNLLENGSIYQFASKIIFINFLNCFISSNNSYKAEQLVFSSIVDFIFQPFPTHF